MNDELDLFTSPGEIFIDFTRAVDAGDKNSTMQLFDKIPKKRLDEAAWYVVSNNPQTPWIEELTQLRPHGNYVDTVDSLCTNNVKSTYFNTACNIFLSTSTELTEQCVLLRNDVFYTLDKTNQNRLIERLKQEPPLLVLKIVMKSNLDLFPMVWSSLKTASDIDSAIQWMTQDKNFNRLVDLLVGGSNTSLVWEVICSVPKTWTQFLQSSLALQDFSLAKSLLNFADSQSIHYSDRLNEILCANISCENTQAVKLLLPYYDCFYGDGVVLKKASCRKNSDIFDIVYDATAPEIRREILDKMNTYAPQDRQMLEDHLNAEHFNKVLSDTLDSPKTKTKRRI